MFNLYPTYTKSDKPLPPVIHIVGPGSIMLASQLQNIILINSNIDSGTVPKNWRWTRPLKKFRRVNVKLVWHVLIFCCYNVIMTVFVAIVTGG